MIDPLTSSLAQSLYFFLWFISGVRVSRQIALAKFPGKRHIALKHKPSHASLISSGYTPFGAHQLSLARIGCLQVQPNHEGINNKSTNVN